MKCQEVDGSANGATWTTLVPAAYTPDLARAGLGTAAERAGCLVTLKM